MTSTQRVLKHIEVIDKELLKDLSNSHNAELLKAKSIALLALRTTRD